MRLDLRRLAFVAALVLAATSALLYLNLVLASYGYVFRYAYASLILVGGVFLTRELASVVSALRRRGLRVTHEYDETFIDAFRAKTDKGTALRSLRRMLGVEGNVMYLGDSVHDNPALDLAQIAVGVCHGQPTENLRCRYLVDYGFVSEMLDRLLDTDLEFTRSIVAGMAGARPQ